VNATIKTELTPSDFFTTKDTKSTKV